MTKPTHADIAAAINKKLTEPHLSAEDLLNLTLAKRLNDCSDNILAQALGGSETPLNFWNKR